MIVENSVTEDSWGLLISVPSDFKWQRTFSLSPNNSLLLYPLFYYKTVDIFIGMDHLFQIKCSFFNAIFSYFLIFLINRVPGLCSTWMIRLWSDKVTEIKYICSWVHNDKPSHWLGSMFQQRGKKPKVSSALPREKNSPEHPILTIGNGAVGLN